MTRVSIHPLAFYDNGLADGGLIKNKGEAPPSLEETIFVMTLMEGNWSSSNMWEAFGLPCFVRNNSARFGFRSICLTLEGIGLPGLAFRQQSLGRLKGGC